MRGATPALLKCVPNVCRNAWMSSVRPRSSTFSMPAALRSRSKIRINPLGTLNNGRLAGSRVGIGSPLRKQSRLSVSNRSASQLVSSMPRSALSGIFARRRHRETCAMQRSAKALPTQTETSVTHSNTSILSRWNTGLPNESSAVSSTYPATTTTSDFLRARKRGSSPRVNTPP